jgi:tetratricopeptide (TPR) repeat protein
VKSSSTHCLFLRGLFLGAVLLPIVPGLQAQSDPEAGLVGSRAKTLNLSGLQDESIQFPSFPPGTHYNILIFWSTWNRFAALEFEDLGKRYARWNRSGVRILGVNVESSKIDAKEKAAAKKWLGEHPAAFPIAFDKDLAAFHAYGVVAVPTTIVIDDSGTIVMKLPGYPVGGASELIRYVEVRLSEAHEGEARTPTKIHTLAYRQAVRHLRQGRFLIRKKRHELAKYTLELAIKGDPKLLDARIELIRLYERLGNEEQATRAMAKAREAFPKNASLMVEAALVAFSRKKLAEAEKLAGEALAINPSLSSAQILLGRLREKQGKPSEALGYYLQASQENALDPRPLLEAGRLYEGQKKLKESLACYEKAYLLLYVRKAR